MAQTQDQHILINGGGLAGLTLALCLARRGIPSTIFELRAEPTTLGGAITLAPNGMRVMDTQAGVLDKLTPHGYQYERIQICVDGDTPIGSVLNGSASQFGYPAMRIPRVRLHAALVAAAEASPLITIRWDASLASITPTPTGVSATLAHSPAESVSGTLLVGCDGTHSATRAHVLGASAPTPTYAGALGVGGTIPAASVTLAGCTPPAIVYTQHGTLLTFPITPAGDVLTWGLQRDVPERSRDGWDAYIKSGDALADCRAVFGPHPPQPIKDMLEKTDNATTRGWPHYALPALPTWHKERVLLIGDAAHAIPPYGGQGAAQAMEDGAYLARLLERVGKGEAEVEATLAHFESVRMARVEFIRSFTAMSGGTRKTEGQGALGFWAKKWAMWAYFRLKGEKALKKEAVQVMSYDVEAEPLVGEEKREE